MKKISKKFVVLLSAIIICSSTLYTTEASIKSYTKDSDGITFTLDKGLMRIKICTGRYYRS